MLPAALQCLWRLVALLFLGSASTVIAGQYLEGSPDDGLTATISRGEPSLIRIEGRKMARAEGAEGKADEVIALTQREDGP